MNTERMKQLKQGLEDQVAQIDALPPFECPEWLSQERDLMIEEIRGIEERLASPMSPMSRSDVIMQTAVRMSRGEAA